MKITEIIPHVIKPGLDSDTDDQSAWAFIEMRTDEGITGWGEATKYGRGGSFLLAHAINMVKEDFIGEDPANIEVLWHKLYRRFTYMGYGGGPEYVQALRDIVVVLMIEKKGAVESLDEILEVSGIDMVQWGPSDYSMSIGKAGQGDSPEIKAVEKHVIESCLAAGVQPRAEINSPDGAKY